MARKKAAAPAPEAQQQERPAPAAQEPGQEAQQTTQEPSQPQGGDDNTPNPDSPQDPPEAPEEGPKALAPEPITADTPFPCKATVTAALAILRRTIGPGTAEMLKPVATLKRGAEITVISYWDGHAQLANGLWIKADYLAR